MIVDLIVCKNTTKLKISASQRISNLKCMNNDNNKKLAI